jgi:hypothetical protein
MPISNREVFNMRLFRQTMVLAAIATLALVAMPSASMADGDESGESPTFLDSTAAVVTNVVPISSAFVQPRCITGYVLCKLSFAGLSVLAAGEQILLGGDVKGASATLGRGFRGDWVVRPSDIASGRKPVVYPEATVDEDSDPYLPPI